MRGRALLGQASCDRIPVPTDAEEQRVNVRRHRAGMVLTWIAAAGFLATAALHGSGYGPVNRLAEDGPAGLRALVPALWLAFSGDLVVLGLIVGAVACRPSTVGRIILVIASLCPAGVAALQLRFLGFVPPTAILLALGALTMVAAAVLPGASGKGSNET